MAVSISTIDPMLMELYDQMVKDQLNQEVLAKQYVEETSRPLNGRHLRFALHTRRNTGVGARAERAALPSAGNQTTVECRVTQAYIYGRIDLSGPAMSVSKHAFAEALSFEMEGVTRDLIFDLGRQTYGEGQGILAQVAADSNSASSVTIFNQYQEPGQPGGRYLQIGQRLQAGNIGALSAQDTSGVDISSITIAQNSGTLTDTVNITATNINFSASDTFLFNVNAGGTGLEIKGLRAIVDDSTATHCYGYSGGFLGTVTLQNVSAETENRWRAAVLNNSQTERLIDSQLMQKLLDSVKRNSGKMSQKLIGEYDVSTAFFDSVSNDRRFNTKDFDAGRSKLSYNGLEFFQDLLAPYNELFALNKECIKWATLKEVGFSNESGAVLKNISGFDVHEAYIRTYCQIFAEHRNGLGVIRDIKTSL